MPNIASALKDEITRLARKELKSQTATLRDAVRMHRNEIATLKKTVASLERQAKRSERKAPRILKDYAPADGNLRFRAAGFAQHRQRLGLSAADMGKLIGASQLSVYKWESGRTKPRAKHLQAIAQIRKLGKREAALRLADLT